MFSTELLSNNLFEQVLVEPAKRGNNELFVLSGYASAAMVTKHFEVVAKELSLDLSIDLHIGMTGRDGLSRNTLLGLQSIPRQIQGRSFNCTMSARGESNHSKIYVWCNDSGPQEAFIGSSNYTQMGFGVTRAAVNHRETCVKLNAEVAFEYVLASSQGGISYRSPDIMNYIDLIDEIAGSEVETDESDSNLNMSLEFVDLPLIMTRPSDNGEVHPKSGLNWGQREGRNPNQAYIPIPSVVSKSNFFPEKGIHFQVITDDGEAFICTVAQDGDKALETPNDNSILGKYFRERLGLAIGAFVTKAHLQEFGSNQVRIYKEDDECYRLSFKPGQLYSQVKN
jgi:hypothetical protein